MSNFAFLQAEWPDLYEAAAKAEALAYPDPRTACFYARRALELAVAWLYKHDARSELPYQDHLSALIHEPTFRQAVGEAVFTKARVIKDLGNLAVHSHQAGPPGRCADGGARAVPRLLTGWPAPTRAAPSPPTGWPSTPTCCPRRRPSRRRPSEQLQELEAQLREKDEKLSALLADKAALDEELQRLREEVAEAKAANAAKPDTHDYSEAETRDYFIDLLLKEAGWPLDQAAGPRVRSRRACPTTRARASSTTCCGATTASRWGWWRPSAPSATRAWASSRPSSTPTAWRSSSGSVRSSSTPTATSTGSGTMPTTRRGRCRGSTRRTNWNC